MLRNSSPAARQLWIADSSDAELLLKKYDQVVLSEQKSIETDILWCEENPQALIERGLIAFHTVESKSLEQGKNAVTRKKAIGQQTGFYCGPFNPLFCSQQTLAILHQPGGNDLHQWLCEQNYAKIQFLGIRPIGVEALYVARKASPNAEMTVTLNDVDMSSSLPRCSEQVNQKMQTLFIEFHLRYADKIYVQDQAAKKAAILWGAPKEKLAVEADVVRKAS